MESLLVCVYLLIGIVVCALVTNNAEEPKGRLLLVFFWLPLAAAAMAVIALIGLVAFVMYVFECIYSWTK